MSSFQSIEAGEKSKNKFYKQYPKFAFALAQARAYHIGSAYFSNMIIFSN
jgi:hypothetical protein